VGVKANSPYTTRIKLCHDFDDDLSFHSNAQHREDWWQVPLKPYINDAAAHRNDGALIRRR
jgi:hypothetical protein